VRILVTNSSYWNALAVVRALGRAGHSVFVAGPRSASRLARQGVATWSRYSAKKLYYTDPAHDAEQYASDIVEILQSESIDVLCPIGIKEVLATLRSEDTIRPLVAIPFGSYEAVSEANDKSHVMRAAAEAGVPTPQTEHVEGIEGLRALQVDSPTVVKTCIGAASQGVWMVPDPERWPQTLTQISEKLEKTEAAERLYLDAERFVVQELIPGRVHDVCLLADHGEVKALLTQERIKTVSLSGGAGLMNVTTREPEIAEYARRLVRHLQYHGLAQVEFIRDSRDGSYRLLEINAKYWGTLALSVAAGIDFPGLAVQLAIGRPVPESFDYRVPLTYRWRFPGEVIAWFKQRKEGASLRSILAPPPGPVRSDWRWSDPLPSVHQVLTTAWKLARPDWSG